MISEHFFPDRESLFSALVDECYSILAETIAAKQSAAMLVSGGGTPRPLYQQLSSKALDWQRVRVALVDERWVDVDHAASNEAFIKETLLKNNAAPAKFIAMKTAHATAGLGQSVCEERYRLLPILQFADLFMEPLREQFDWGISLSQMISGMLQCHPNYPTNLLTFKMHTADDIYRMLKDLPEEQRGRFKKAHMDAARISFLGEKVQKESVISSRLSQATHK